MAIPKLPTEIILMIAEESCREIEYSRLKNQLLALYSTCRVLRDLAGRRIFRSIPLPMNSQRLLQDAKILGQPHIGRFIKNISVWLHRTQKRKSHSNHDPSSSSFRSELETGFNGYKWTPKMSECLYLIFSAASKSLTKLWIDMSGGHLAESFKLALTSSLVAIFDTFDFQNFKTFKIEIDDRRSCRMWWGNFWKDGNYNSKFRNNLQRIQCLEMKFLSSYGITNPACSRRMEDWIGALALKELKFESFGEISHRNEVAIRPRAAPILTSTMLHKLHLIDCAFSDALSPVFKNLQCLKSISLVSCSIDYLIDRWKFTFDRWMTLGLVSFELKYCYYSQMRYRCCNGAILCSPFKEDKDKLDAIIAHLRSLNASVFPAGALRQICFCNGN